MKIPSLFCLSVIGAQQGRRPSALQFTGGRDVFAQTDRNENSAGQLSVADLDLDNRLKPNLRCDKPMVPGSLSLDDGRIVGGYQAERHAWPFIVKIRIGCGGSIVSNNWIVTAAHCCRVSNIRFLDVTVGEYDRGANDVGARTYRVKSKTIHPQFVQTTLKNDICLLELEESITFSSVAQPVCFPEKNSRIDQVKLGEGPLCYVAGWGRIGEQLGTARILQETQVPIVNNTVCDAAYQRNNINETAMLCAGYAEGGIDACQGDSGGPMICVEDNQPVLRGVVSWGIGCARSGLYGVYTRTSSFIDWIQNTINPNNLNAGQMATTVRPTTTKVTTPTPTLAPNEKTASRDCGDPKKNKALKLNKAVTVGCIGNECALRCPEGLKPSYPKSLKCVVTRKKKTWSPKKIKRGVHCISDGSSGSAQASSQASSGGFSSGGSGSQGGFGSSSSSSIAALMPEANTKCGNVVKHFKIDPTKMSVDCKTDSKHNSMCTVSCVDKSFKPTREMLKCGVRGRKAKFQPKKATIRCNIPVDRSSKQVRKLDTLAEETCGYLPILIDKPANYFCEDYTCNFYCSNEHMQPNVQKLTCNPRKKSWWPKRLTVFCQ